MSLYSTPETRPPLGENLYMPTNDDLAFWMQQTRIGAAAALKRHILDVQKKAYELYGYPCIRIFDFLQCVLVLLTRLPAYEQIMQLARERPGALFLDIGCCFGHDTRGVAADGWPTGGIIASAGGSGTWGTSSSQNMFPVAFVEGDALDPGMTVPHAPFYAPPDILYGDVVRDTALN